MRQDMASCQVATSFQKTFFVRLSEPSINISPQTRWTIFETISSPHHSIFGILWISLERWAQTEEEFPASHAFFHSFVFGHFRADWVFRFDWNEFCQPTGCPFVTISDVRLFVPLERSLIDGSSTLSPSFRLFLASWFYSLTSSCTKRKSAWEKEKELDILRFLTTIGLYVDRWRKTQNDDRDWQSGQRGEGRGKGECVKACTATKDHEKFLEIGLYEGEREETSRREIEVMRLILCFLCFQRTAVSFGYRTRVFFSRFAPFYVKPHSSLALFSHLLLSLSLSFSRGIMRPSCHELLRLYLFFFSRVSRPYIKRCRTLDDLSMLGRLEIFRFFSDARYKYEKFF